MSLADGINKSLSSILNSFKKEKHLKGSDWANKFFYLSKESSYIDGKWVGYPYQNILLDLMCHRSIQEIAFKKAARMGATVMMDAAIGYGIEHLKSNQIIYEQSDSAAVTFSKTHIDGISKSRRS